MKLFSKPKSIGISKDKDVDKKDKPLPSPNKFGSNPLPRPFMNSSTLSLAESTVTTSSFYSQSNSSTGTIIPVGPEKEKEKHKHHFLSRQKKKDKDDHHIQLSSASSNSKPLDPSAPQSIYSFAPSSPSPAATSFSKSMSGLDLRHGGRALREKKKEEKAGSSVVVDGVLRESELSGSEWPGQQSSMPIGAASYLGPTTSSSFYSGSTSLGGDTFGSQAMQGFGVPGMATDDAWPYLKAKLLNIFEGEDLRLPIEDFNRLVL
jgi:hypothetical protein